MCIGRSAFHDTRLNFERSYLDTDWGMRTVAFAGYGCPLQADIPVHGMMTKLQEEYPERRDELIKMLGVDPNWRMHQVSDGQRRRVQILLGLIRPFKILLLDEVTVSLDVVVRQDLLRWLRRESETRGILYFHTSMSHPQDTCLALSTFFSRKKVKDVKFLTFSCEYEMF